jgi:outer membrane protein TolC
VTTDPLNLPGERESRTIDELYAIALRTRPDAVQAHLQAENAELSLRGSESALRPQLDVVATATNSALAGVATNGHVTADPLLNGGYGTALSQLVHNNFPTYSIGVQFALPIRNSAARSDLLRDEIGVRQQQIRIRQLEKQIRLEVTNASIALDQARETCEATRSERVFQEQALATEQQKLEAGASTSYAVIQYQRDLAAARSSEISALANYQKAKTALDRVLGTILDEHHIVLDDALRGPVGPSSAQPQRSR